MSHLDLYLDLERKMLALENADDPLADTVRDSMDAVWYRLSDEDRQYLDSRVTTTAAGECGRRTPAS